MATDATVVRESNITIANRISKYWNDQRLNIENYFKVYKDAEVNKFFWCSCLLGGILKTEKVSKTIKRIWLACNISSIIVMLILNAVCLICYEELNKETLVNFLKPVIAIVWLCSGQALMYLNSDLIETYANKIDKRMEEMTFDENALNLNEKESTIESIFSCGPSWFFIVGLLAKHFLRRFEMLDGILCYYYPFNDDFDVLPGVILAIILFLQFLTTIPFSTGIYSLFKLMRLYVSMEKRMSDFYIKQISSIGLSTLQQMESNHNEELLMEQNEALESANLHEEFIRQRNAIEENFEKEMAYSSKQMWSLIQIQLHLRALFENGCAASLLAAYITTIPFSGKILVAIHNPDQITVPVLNACLFSVIGVFFFYKLCCIGSQLSGILDESPIEVYSTPWYMMSKKTRRTIHIILAQTQYQHHLRIFKTVPIDMRLFYRLVDSLYSNASVFRSILEK